MQSDLYRSPLALLTDLYQLTMAYGYWKLGRAEEEAVFHLFFRKRPFGSGYVVAAGLESAIQYVRSYRFEPSDLEYLASLTGNDYRPLFERAFIEYLADLRITCDIDAMPEGTLVFARQPLLRVTGTILQCQLLETPLLNVINFQTLIATKASRICSAAQGEAVLEFGLRRAQGFDGGLTASRAAYIGGCAATSNVLAGKLYGIPVRGTHAHSWVMSFDDEIDAFDHYADVMPNNCVFLVDTYDTIQGIHKAVQVGDRLRQKGYEMLGIRLDSGDLAYLSIQARKILDQAGFPNAKIVASNDLDERIIETLKDQGAQITVWGVGTKLVTADDQPALGGVYKLGALRRTGEPWTLKIKLSDQHEKVSIPGILQVRRFKDPQGMVGDMIYDEIKGPDPRRTIVDGHDSSRRKQIAAEVTETDLLVPTLRNGRLASTPPSLETIRALAQDQLASLDPSCRRLMDPHEYPNGLDIGLHEERAKMIQSSKESSS